MTGGRRKRNDAFETPRTKFWYGAVRDAVAHKHGLTPADLTPQDVRRFVDPNDESNIWYKYADGIHSPINITNYKDSEGERLTTLEWIDQGYPGTAKAYLIGPARIWEVIDAWSIAGAYDLLKGAFHHRQAEMVPLQDLIDEQTYTQSECWFSPHQMRLYWGAEQISISAVRDRPHLTMQAIAWGVACGRFMDWHSPLDRVLGSEQCMAWLKQHYGLDPIELCFTPEITDSTEMMSVFAEAGREFDLKIKMV